MSTEALDRVRSQMTSLSVSERATLALELIKSLDESRASSVDKPWDDELARRISMVREGEAKLLTRTEFREKVKARLGL